MSEINELISISKESSYPLVVGGDFNAQPGSNEISTLISEFKFACTSNCPLTFPSNKPKVTIDYVILNPSSSKIFHIQGYNVIPNISASDHLPLVEHLEYLGKR